MWSWDSALMLLDAAVHVLCWQVIITHGSCCQCIAHDLNDSCSWWLHIVPYHHSSWCMRIDTCHRRHFTPVCNKTQTCIMWQMNFCRQKLLWPRWSIPICWQRVCPSVCNGVHRAGWLQWQFGRHVSSWVRQLTWLGEQILLQVSHHWQSQKWCFCRWCRETKISKSVTGCLMWGISRVPEGCACMLDYSQYLGSMTLTLSKAC